MALTLRDAQHLCWKNFRKINDNLKQESDKALTPLTAITDLLKETENVAVIVKTLGDLEVAQRADAKEKLAEKLSNLLYIIFVLAENYNIELEEAFLQTVNDYMLKFIG